MASQLDPANVHVITDEADPCEFYPGRAGGFRGRAGIADETPLVGSVARIDTWKGFDTLLAAFPDIRRGPPTSNWSWPGQRWAARMSTPNNCAGGPPRCQGCTGLATGRTWPS